MAGFGGALLSFVTSLLADGTWTLAVAAFDSAANPASAGGGTEAAVTLAGTPEAPDSLAAASWDDGESAVTMTLGLSADDADDEGA